MKHRCRHPALRSVTGISISQARRAFVVIGLGLGAASVQAESLRCTRGAVAEGDSRLSLLHKCGAPTLSDSSCAPVVYGGTAHVVPDVFARAWVPCQPVEDLLYERGPGNLIATVRVRSGVVRSIRYSRQAE